MTDVEKLALIREQVDFWRHFGAENAGVQALCEVVTAILNGDNLSDRAVMDILR